MNRMPSRWSISCWRQRASSPSASMRTGAPSASSASTTTFAGRSTTSDTPGMLRQPSSARAVSSLRSTTRGLTSAYAGASDCGTSSTTMRRETPTCGAASPCPFAAYIVSNMSRTSRRTSSSTASTSAARSRSTGAPSIAIFNTAIARFSTFPFALTCTSTCTHFVLVLVHVNVYGSLPPATVCRARADLLDFPLDERSIGGACPLQVHLRAARDEPDAALVHQVRPRPLDHHDQPVAEPDQHQHVHEHPDQPGGVAAEPDASEVRDGRGAADGRERSLVVVAEPLARLALQVPLDLPRHEPARLDRALRDPRHLRAIDLEVREVADHEDLGVPRHRAIRLDHHAARPVQRRAQRARDGRCRHARGP